MITDHALRSLPQSNRQIKDVVWLAGLIPNGDSLEPDGDTLTPSFGVYGQFEYTINGTTYTLPNSPYNLDSAVA